MSDKQPGWTWLRERMSAGELREYARKARAVAIHCGMQPELVDFEVHARLAMWDDVTATVDDALRSVAKAHTDFERIAWLWDASKAEYAADFGSHAITATVTMDGRVTVRLSPLAAEMIEHWARRTAGAAYVPGSAVLDIEGSLRAAEENQP